ncbi:hypothetical protein A9J31_13980 [Acinetobacter gandensis]|uniref:Uncharacterized protein n=1 Tax=Acinetobacter gandensis TaxID=1443941 RepID=A0A1A7RD32_9GAMM|nr:hypothetical protein A9J31_13980 [Acinetobacter gandensis]
MIDLNQNQVIFYIAIKQPRIASKLIYSKNREIYVNRAKKPNKRKIDVFRIINAKNLKKIQNSSFQY